MRDAARAAAMSDPIMNRWFRRRWFDCDAVPAAEIAEGKRDELELTGLALLAAWRKQRRSEQALVS